MVDEARVTQAPTEVIGRVDNPATRITQAPVEVIGQTDNPRVRVTQSIIEVIYALAPEPVPSTGGVDTATALDLGLAL